jgi:hypothetical protein
MGSRITIEGEGRHKWADVIQEVLNKFKLQGFGLLCYFGTERFLDPMCAESERGVFWPTKNRGYGNWPDEIRCALPGHDALIYLPESTCRTNDKVFFAMTFAHELRHFEQWMAHSRILEAGKLLLKLPRRKAKTMDWDFPHERDAIITSKRVTEEMAGKSGVQEYTDNKIAQGNYVAYWKFFRKVSPSSDFDWVRETKALVDKCKPELQALKDHDIDFSIPNWTDSGLYSS